jgi:hypothetical protein
MLLERRLKNSEKVKDGRAGEGRDADDMKPADRRATAIRTLDLAQM